MEEFIMKKIFAIVITVAMLLSMGALLINAELPDVPFTAGGYSAEEFATVGTVKITWDPEASSKLDVTNGDMSDWAAADYNMVTVDTSNMVYWVNDTTNGTGVPAGWQIQTYFVADKDYLYIGFYVTDPAFAYGSAGGHYDGDAFQVCIDFGGLMGKTLKEDPDALSNPKNIFYSFSCTGDGQPLEIWREEADNNGIIAAEEGVKGAAAATESGWAAEFALPFQMLYDDYEWKAWAEDPKIYVGSDQRLPLNIGCCLYYLDRSATAGTINWAAGSTNGIADDGGVPQVSWTAYDNGINLELDYVDGIEFTCPGIVVTPLTETTPEETEAPTEPETEAPETEAPTAAPETEAPETEAPATDAPATEAPTTEAEGGCGSVIGFSVIAVLAAAAAAVALKKD
jgi:hypothetical protein